MTTETTNIPDATEGAEQVPLVVDLDGTLCRTDTLHEGLLSLVSQDPKTLLQVPGWLREGRAGFKAHVADRLVLGADDLPLNADVVERIKAARAEGRRVALVSAADHRQVTAIAEATGLFDEAYGSAEGTNLKGDEKARFLTEKYGERGFDYLGDSQADVPVWSVARRAITVAASSSVQRAAADSNSEVEHIAEPVGNAGAMLRAMRPHQWSKNLLIFLPLLAAHDATAVLSVVLAFAAFSLTASAIYVLNDLVDLSADRAHPRKRKRPFAAGELSATQGLTLAGCLILLALALGLMTGAPRLLAIIGIYLIATVSYSLWLKRKLVADILALAALYTIRIVAGGAAAAIDLSPWMLAFSMFLFLSLAAVKRQAELTDLLDSAREGAGRAYTVDDLPVVRGVAISSCQAAVLVLALYITSDDVRTLYAYPALLWLICPLLLYWQLRMVMKAHRGLMSDDPIIFALKDKVSLSIITSAVLIGLAAAIWPWTPPTI